MPEPEVEVDAQHHDDVDDHEATTLKKVYAQSDLCRRQVLASYWFILLLAIPLWWTTTSIVRLALPTALILEEGGRKLSLGIDITLGGGDTNDLDLVSYSVALQESLERACRTHGNDDIRFNVRTTTQGQLEPDSSSSYTIYFDTNSTSTSISGRTLRYGVGVRASPPTPTSLTTTLLPLLGLSPPAPRVLPFSPRYRLAFSLLNEDASDAAYGWDVREALASTFAEPLQTLSLLHNFTLESQVQFHAPLAFQPKFIPNQGEGKEEGEGKEKGIYGLTHEQLTVFINSAEWTLSSSVSTDPVIHFIAFVPSSKRPLRILDSNDLPLPSNAFTVPQWGGIYILNPSPSSSHQQGKSSLSLPKKELEKMFITFRSQLFALLGVPTLPSSSPSKGPNPLISPSQPELISPSQPELISPFQLSALLRLRTLETYTKSRDTLASIVQLVTKLDGMPVGKEVESGVRGALDALREANSPSSSQTQTHPLTHTSHALDLASRAFFHPGMLAMLYFPAEHKLAVYSPLFAPVAVPLVAAVVREYVGWRKARRAAAAR